MTAFRRNDEIEVTEGGGGSEKRRDGVWFVGSFPIHYEVGPPPPPALKEFLKKLGL